MTLHYLKIALRNMRRFKLQTLVCLTGLAVGMTCFSLGTLWLRYIESFEDFVPNAENIYMALKGDDEAKARYEYSAGADEYKDFLAQMPGITRACQLGYNRQPAFVSTDGEREMSMRIAYADTAFTGMFALHAVEGSLRRFADGEVAVTRSTARRLWGDEQAVGKSLVVKEDGGKLYHVVAVIDDRPLNTQFDFELLAHNEDKLHRKTVGSSLMVPGVNVFLEFSPAVPRESIVGRRSLEYVTDGGKRETQYTIAPLRSLRTDYISRHVKISTSYVRYFMALGVMVILCSLANYLITMVSHLRRRGWEMSLRRVLGSSRAGILLMVSLETLIIFLLSVFLCAAITWFVLPYFREYSGIGIPLAAVAAKLGAYLALVIAGGMLLSAITAWIVMARTQRNILSSRTHSPSLRGRGSGGEALQMALAMGIIFCATVMLRQVHMIMFSNEYGMSVADRVLVQDADEGIRSRIRQLPFVEETLENADPIFPRTYWISFGVAKEESNRGDWINYIGGAEFGIDSATVRFYDMRIVSGQLPSADKYKDLTREDHFEADINGTKIPVKATFRVKEAALNEEYCRKLGWTAENAIGRSLWDHWNEYRISGVLADVYHYGPTSPPDAILFLPKKESGENNIAVRTAAGRAAELVDSLQHWMKQTDFHNPSVRVFNCEKNYAELIASEQMLIKILLAVGGASLFVCVIGTFSLVSLSLQQRRKEIAIRKVHGARMRDILRIFLRSHILSLCAAAVVAYPVAYIIMRSWLENYQKQISIPLWLIPATFLSIAAIVLLTISLKIWRTARESTVEALNG